MRPNSLFFDRTNQKSLSSAVSFAITIAFLALMGYILIRYQRFGYLLRTELMTTPMFGLLLVCYVALAVFAIVAIRWANCRVRRMPVLWAISIFLVAILPRAGYLLALRAPSFGGAVLGRANLSAFFAADNRLSVILLLISALCSVVLYLIARYLDDGSAPAAGLLFALYPANVALARLAGGFPIVLLLALLAVLFALAAFSAEKRGRAAALSAMAGGVLALCGAVLASAWLIALALFIMWLVLFLSSLQQQQERRRLLVIAVSFLSIFFALSMAVRLSPARDPLDLNLSGANEAGLTQQLRDGDEIIDQFNWNTLQQGYGVQGHPVRLDQSLADLWLEKDAALASESASSEVMNAGLTNLLSGIRLLDFFFLAGVYLFAWIGGLLRRRGGAADLLLWVILLWAGAHLFSDRQAITRLLGAPLLMIFASYGAFALVGTEPRPKETHKYESCVNRGALNLGDIPPNSAGLNQTGAFHPKTGGAKGDSAGGVFGAMEAQLRQPKKPEEQNGGESI